MYSTLESLPIETCQEIGDYCLAIFRCGEDNKERAIVLIEKSSGESICELLKDEEGFVGGDLGRAHKTWEQEKLKGRRLEIAMGVYFRLTDGDLNRMFHSA